ncbi:MAG: hypothetical protein R3185_09220 [Candidatus Thermoplasmatota archaeon]|nr:hypothetical protein [Candidatus Thermoplasmatota archaeon]
MNVLGVGDANVTSEYASQTNTTSNPIADVVVYWRVSALALLAVALLGTALNIALGTGAWIVDPGFLTFDWTHNVVHYLLAATAGVFGFTGLARKKIAATMAVVVGVVYLGLGIVGFIPGVVSGLDGLLGLHLELGENLVHLLLGGWATYAGLSS